MSGEPNEAAHFEMCGTATLADGREVPGCWVELNVVTVESRTEWRVESETTEDEFGTDEKAAREWLSEVQQKVREGEPHWEPAALLTRTVTVTTTPWTPPAAETPADQGGQS